MDENIHNFINYLGKPVSDNFVDNFYETYNIKHDRIRLYRDFIESLTYIISTTYMGDDVTNLPQKQSHFKWAWKKNIYNFKKEGIIFKNGDLYNYFRKLFMDIYYIIELKNKKLIDNINLLWEILFGYRKDKTEADLEMFLMVYNLFENSINISLL